jgi:hypothetical protein
MSEERLPTVKVKSGDSYAIINESDFDAAVHVPYVDIPPPPAPFAPPPPPVSADPLDNLPPDWESMHGTRLKSIAAAVGGRSVENADQARDVIRAELAKRKT